MQVEGGNLKAGDGMVLRGANDLFVICKSDNEITRVTLADGWGSGRMVERLSDPRLHYPTTAAINQGSLMVVNGQSDKQKSPPALLPFDVRPISLPQ